MAAGRRRKLRRRRERWSKEEGKGKKTSWCGIGGVCSNVLETRDS